MAGMFESRDVFWREKCRLVLIFLFLAVTHAQDQQKISIRKVMREQLLPGHVVEDLRQNPAFSAVVTSGNDLDYTILTEGNKQITDYFKINKTSGVLKIDRIIDREVVCPFRPVCELLFQVAARAKFGTFFLLIDFRIEVTDLNDNSPEFKPDHFELHIPENTLIGRQFQLPVANDKDFGVDNGVEEYRILAGGDPWFGLDIQQLGPNSSSIYLTLKQEVNRESSPQYEVLVGAVDGGQPKLTGTLTVDIKIKDTNDNAPVFDQNLYKVTIKEEHVIGALVQKVRATDADEGENKKIVYRFSELQPQDDVRYFRLHPDTGEITVVKSVEALSGKEVSLDVEASDSGHPPKVARAKVQVFVEDSVNSQPVIVVDTLGERPGVAEVSEYGEIGKVLAFVKVKDPDSGVNGEVTCSMDDEVFTLQELQQDMYKRKNDLNFMVKMMQRLDREERDRYRVDVICQDRGFPRLISNRTFTVQVLDENDNPPVFSKSKYFASIEENNQPGKLVHHLIATDKDIGVNAKLVYQVEGSQRDVFGVHKNGTVYAKVALDREESAKRDIHVTVRDSGDNPKIAAATIVLELTDVNDVIPYFDKMIYNFDVKENQPIGTLVNKVRASDDDVGSNQAIYYHFPQDYLDSPGASFVIDRLTGNVKTSRSLDREKKGEETHKLLVLATDHGSPPLTGTASIVITVTDTNDNKPYFLYPNPSNNSLAVPHSFEKGEKLVQISALDDDKGLNSEIVYSISSINGSSPFEVQPETGVMFIGRKLKSGDCGTYTLHLIATDRGPTVEHSQQEVLFVDVFFDNSTLANIGSAGASTSVITIAAVLGAVLMVGILVLVIFILYKKHEARRKKGVPSSASSSSTAKLHGGYYIAPGVRGSQTSFLGKQEVGTSNHGHDSNPYRDTNPYRDGDGMKSTNPYVVMVPGTDRRDNTPEIVEIACNGHHPLTDHTNTADLDDDGPFSTFRSQEDILSGPYSRAGSVRQNLDNSIAKLPLDGDETSLDSTSDSGRGGSDLENAANKARGATPISLKSGISNRLSPGPREQERTFHTFRGESPAYPFDSDSDTLTRRLRPDRTSPAPLTSSPRRLPSTSSTLAESDTDTDLTPRGRPTYPPTMHNLAGIHPHSSFRDTDSRDGSLPRQPIRVAPLPMFSNSYPRQDSDTEQSDLEPGSNSNSLSRRNHVPRLPLNPGIEFTHNAFGGSGSNRSSANHSDPDNPYSPGFVDYNQNIADGLRTFHQPSDSYTNGMPSHVMAELRNPRPISVESDFLLPPYPEVEDHDLDSCPRLSVHDGLTGFSPERDAEREALFPRSRLESSA